jgi:2-polyprenyl-6-hydroxyphenyl methylase/3-demethylubiquinone-9 3-methyltransferase
MNRHPQEVALGQRFEFGANWMRFLSVLNDERIALAEQSLRQKLGVGNLQGKRFLDIGSGSGLFSLAARRLGATVHSFDYDPKSVECTLELKRRYFADDAHWQVEQGSVLDMDYLQTLGNEWDIVYSWGVLHHTGAQWRALANVFPLVRCGGKLFLAIYNDQGRPSERWVTIKKAYCAAPQFLKKLIIGFAFLRLWGPTTIRDLVNGNPGLTWRGYGKNNDRGMSPWHDVVDWIGGYPFEVSKPEEIFDFFRAKDFQLEKLRTCAGGLGCNEFVFLRQ